MMGLRAQVLGHIEAGNLLPPVVVLQMLAASPGLRLALVKGGRLLYIHC